MRGAIPSDFRIGGSRVNIVAATNATNSAPALPAVMFKAVEMNDSCCFDLAMICMIADTLQNNASTYTDATMSRVAQS
jgi:hypothetical protein